MCRLSAHRPLLGMPPGLSARTGWHDASGAAKTRCRRITAAALYFDKSDRMRQPKKQYVTDWPGPVPRGSRWLPGCPGKPTCKESERTGWRGWTSRPGRASRLPQDLPVFMRGQQSPCVCRRDASAMAHFPRRQPGRGPGPVCPRLPDRTGARPAEGREASQNHRVYRSSFGRRYRPDRPPAGPVGSRIPPSAS